MGTDPENVPNSQHGRQALERLQVAFSEWNHGGGRGGSPLSPKQQLDGLFWALLQTDPLIEVHDHLPPEVLAAIPPAPPMNPSVLADLMGKLEQVGYVYFRCPHPKS